MLISFASKEEISQMSADELYAYILTLEKTPVPEYQFKAGTDLTVDGLITKVNVRNLRDISLIQRITLAVIETKNKLEQMSVAFDLPMENISGFPADAWLEDLAFIYKRAITLDRIARFVAIKNDLKKMISSEYANSLALSTLVEKV